MSRSYRKNPIIHYAPESGAWGKRQANKKVRRTRDIPDGKVYKKCYCSWNIHDCRSRYTINEYFERWSRFIDFCEANGMDWKNSPYGGTLHEAIKKWKKDYFWK